MTALYDSVLEAFPEVTRPLEGCVLWPYLDIFGLATLGYGCLVDAPLEFRKPWPMLDVHHVDQERAALKASQKALHFKRYEHATDLRITQEGADSLLRARAEEFAASMASHYFRDWYNWPADAQLAWMLIAWACGPGCPRIFSTAAALAAKRDWEGARKWARINPGTPGAQNWNPGVVPRNAQIDLCLANAAAIDSPDGYSTPALYWPGHVRDEHAPIAETANAALASFSLDECGITGHCHLAA